MNPYYEDDAVTIYHGKCEEVLPLVSAVDLCVTSPPYNTLTERTITGGGIHARSGWASKVRSDGYQDDRTEPEYWAWQAHVAAMIGAASRPGASLFYNHKLRYRDSAPVIPLEFIDWPGWDLRQEVIWSRDGSMVFNARMFPPSDERIYWFVRSGAAHHWNADEGNKWMSVWNIRQVVGTAGHPCPYPIEIPQRAILATTDPGDLVLDPFMGSGTTLRAAKDLGRRSIGIDECEAYCEIAAKRMGQGVLDFGAAS